MKMSFIKSGRKGRRIELPGSRSSKIKVFRYGSGRISLACIMIYLQMISEDSEEDIRTTLDNRCKQLETLK